MDESFGEDDILYNNISRKDREEPERKIQEIADAGKIPSALFK